MWGIIIPLLIGLAIGYFTPGKTDKSQLYIRAFLWAVLIAAIVTVIGWFTDFNPLGWGDVGFFGLVWSFAVSLVLVVVGVWIGDMIESRTHGGRREMRRRESI